VSDKRVDPKDPGDPPDDPDEDPPFLRWHVTVYYRTENGLLDLHYDIEELLQLHVIVEQGPNFYTIDHIEVVLNHDLGGELTLEASQRGRLLP
jgi:hypothetical protein